MAELTLPGSKSLTNRAFVTAALADGRSTLEGALFSEDTEIFAAALRKLGIAVSEDREAARFVVDGQAGALPAKEASIHLGLSGTTGRFLPPMLMLGGGRYALDGVPAMRVRPMRDLFDLLTSWGARIQFSGEPGFFPCEISGGALPGGRIALSAAKTSQQLSGVLLVSPYAARDSEIEVTEGMVSPSYIAMTLGLMRDWGAKVEQRDAGRFFVPGRQTYRARTYAIEPDASSASYFFAAAALTGGDVRVRHLGRASQQGDIKFCDILEAMGCAVERGDDFIRVCGPDRLRGGDFDMNDISDTAPTLAAIAPFAEAPVTIRRVEHMRWKETDRVAAVANELRRLGVTLEERADGLTIFPGAPHGAVIETYGDHRMAMSFAVTALRTDGIVIDNPECVSKTFPDFFTRWARLTQAP
ncbi:MAG: 3-phosphoshikimate 1-carboxyvinyltransferase [Hyphomonadaceae bacterium]